MKVLIVGGGIGGLTLAAFLESSSIEYEIVERCPDWKHQGFVIGLWDNGRDILKKLGLSDELDASGTRIHSYSIRDGDGHLIRSYDLRAFYRDFGTALTCIDRADLHYWLLKKVNVQKIRMNMSVKDVRNEGGNVFVAFTDGSQAKYDVVIGADGAHSVVRRLIFKNMGESYNNWRIWHAWIDDKFNVAGTLTEYIEPSEIAVVLRANGKTHASFLAPADHTAWDTPEGRAERLKKLMKDESVLVPALREHKDTDLQPSDLMEIDLKKWVEGRVALLGDAAHCFGPHAALGGSMAMEDAYVLASELMRVSEHYSLTDALRNYEAKRMRRVAIARNISKKIRAYTLVRGRLMRSLLNMFVHFVPDRFLTREYNQLLRQEI